MMIRPETTLDIDAIDQLNRLAFKTKEEANIVKRLRATCGNIISLVCEDSKNGMIGHILFSPMTLLGHIQAPVKIAGLAPMCVHPDHQRQGIGHQLMKAGINACKQQGYEAICVLGHPTYYPKFGFQPSTIFNLRSTYDAPEDTFMMLELTPGILRLKNVNGVLKYHPALN